MFKLFLFLIVCLVCINAGNVYPSPDAGQLSKLYQSEVAEIEHGKVLLFHKVLIKLL